ncbi:MAG: MFS transporter [Chloroflexi bacterium]|nr:MFS transporter [Chloroflexota bacterium]
MKDKLALSVLTLGHTLVHWYFQGFLLIVPFVIKEFNLSFTQAGLLVSYRTVLGAIVNIPAGALVDWLGKRRLILAVSILWSALIYLMVGLSPNYVILQIMVALVGIGGSTWHPAAMSTLSNRFPARRGFALSLHEFGANLGDALAPLVIGIMLVTIGWREVLGINAIPGIALAVGLWFLMGRFQEKRSANMNLKNYATSLKVMVTNRLLIKLSSISALRTMSQNVINTFLPIYLINVLAMKSDKAGLMVALLTLPSLATGLVVGTISDRTGRKSAMSVCLWASAAAMAFLGIFQSGYLFMASLVVLGLFLFSVRPVLFAYALEITPKETGATTVGFIFGLNTAFAALAPLIAGIVADRVGALSTFYMGSALVLGSAILTMTLPAVARHKKEAPAPAPVQKAA